MPNETASALRQAPRVTTNSAAKVSVGAKHPPVATSRVINISVGGALLLVTQSLTSSAVISVELGEPIFGVPVLIAGRVTHCDPAPESLRATLITKPGARAPAGYLVGVQWTNCDPHTMEVIAQFVQGRLALERRQRGAKPGTARDRAVAVRRAAVPNWAYALGLLLGLYRGALGLAAGQDDLTVALAIAATLVAAWTLGWLATKIWTQLDAWHEPVAIFVAHSNAVAPDGSIPDADSLLDPDLPAETPAGRGADPPLTAPPERSALPAPSGALPAMSAAR